ncbi:hypothetical protein V498_07967, partial [Pseudogymnoascus sp. VKM F-4517 (FW-2822)]
MSGVGEAGLVLGIISAIISIIDTTKQVYDAVKDEAGLPTNFKKSATKLPLISKLLEDAERYVNNAANESIKAAFTPTLEDCKVQATHLQELFQKVMPEEGDSRWDRYGKAARTIGKGGRVESLVGGILDDLQLLATKFPEVTTPRGKDELAKAIEEVIGMESSLSGYPVHCIDATTKQSLIDLLYFTKIGERLTNLKAAQGETWRWFLAKPEYTSWHDVAQQPVHGGFLWIKGHPSTGKSTLMKLLVEEAKLNANGDSSKITFSFFFLARGTVEEMSTMDLYRSLLHHLFEKAVELRDSLEWMTADGARAIQRNGWHEEALKQTLT